MPVVRPVRRPQPHGVRVREDWTLVVLDDKGKDWIEVRPSRHTTLGPVLDFYRVNGPEPIHLVRFPIFSVRELIKYLPTAINAAHRAKAQ
jgi:hypothetical protein